VISGSEFGECCDLDEGVLTGALLESMVRGAVRGTDGAGGSYVFPVVFVCPMSAESLFGVGSEAPLVARRSIIRVPRK